MRGKLTLLDHPDARYQAFNIGTGKPTSILELSEILIQLNGKNFQPNVIHKFRSGDIRHCYADISKILSLGFESKITLKEGLKELVEWGEQQNAVSAVDHAHKQLVEKGLVA